MAPTGLVMQHLAEQLELAHRLTLVALRKVDADERPVSALA